MGREWREKTTQSVQSPILVFTSSSLVCLGSGSRHVRPSRGRRESRYRLGMWVDVRSLFYVQLRNKQTQHFLSMEGTNRQTVEWGFDSFVSYLPWPYDDFSKEIANLTPTRAHWRMIDLEHLLILPMLEPHPHTPSQVVTLWGCPTKPSHIQIHPASQKHLKLQHQIQVIVSARLEIIFPHFSFMWILLVYYRIYADDGAIPSKTPVNSSDPFLGRIKVRSVPPPSHSQCCKREHCKSGEHQRPRKH